MSRLLASLFAVVLSPALVAVEHQRPAGYQDLSRRKDAPALPPGLRTALVVPSGRILLGSPWQVHYVLRNVGQGDIAATAGWDDRNSVRPTRYWFEAVAPDGRFGRDPFAFDGVDDWGGMGLRVTVPPGGEQRLTVNPRLFVRFDRPGRWTLRLYHDLGFAISRSDDDPRWATVEVELVMPDAAQAAQVLAEQEALFGGWNQGGQLVTGREGPPPADFSAMAFPVYLPLLDERARRGSLRAIQAIAEIPTPEAIDSLLGILARPPVPLPEAEAAVRALPPAHIHTLALNALARRIPGARERQLLLGPGSRPLMDSLDLRRAVRIAEAAQARMDDPDPAIRGAARNLRRICPVDPGQLAAEIGRALDGQTQRGEMLGLLAAWEQLVPDAPPPPGQIADALWLLRLVRRPEERPAGYEDRLEPLLAHPHALLRQLAVQALPGTTPARWAPAFLRLMQDEDEQVRWWAFSGVGRCRDRSLLPALTAALDDTRYRHMAAVAIGSIEGRHAEALLWLDRFQRGASDQEKREAFSRCWYAFTMLNAASRNNDVAEMGQAFIEPLRAFIFAHQADLVRGPLVPDATWPTDIMPPTWYLWLRDQGTWPPGRR